jgi:hypothetical protein
MRQRGVRSHGTWGGVKPRVMDGDSAWREPVPVSERSEKSSSGTTCTMKGFRLSGPGQSKSAWPRAGFKWSRAALFLST